MSRRYYDHGQWLALFKGRRMGEAGATLAEAWWSGLCWAALAMDAAPEWLVAFRRELDANVIVERLPGTPDDAGIREQVIDDIRAAAAANGRGGFSPDA